MNLQDYLNTNQITKSKFAKTCGVSKGMITHITKNTRRPSPELSKKIEQITKGKVSVLELLFPTEN